MENNFYELVGGEKTFVHLVDIFYSRVIEDPILSPMYPKDDMDGSKKRLCMFLIQYWGGPQDYSEQRGAPRLRMRHRIFHINSLARDAWLKHMRVAVSSLDLSDGQEKILWNYLYQAAHSLVNVQESLDSDSRKHLPLV